MNAFHYMLEQQQLNDDMEIIDPLMLEDATSALRGSSTSFVAAAENLPLPAAAEEANNKDDASIILDWTLHPSLSTSTTSSGISSSEEDNDMVNKSDREDHDAGAATADLDASTRSDTGASIVSTDSHHTPNNEDSTDEEVEQKPPSSLKRKRDADNCNSTTTLAASSTSEGATSRSATEDDETTLTAADILSSLANKKAKESTDEEDNSNNNQSDNSIVVNNDVDLAIENFPPTKLLPNIHPDDQGKKCLVLDLDETLIHSSVLMPYGGADFVVQLPVENEERTETVYVMKRPGVDQFLLEMAKHYEIIVFTAGTQNYAEPLLNLLDPSKQLIRTRLFRDSCLSFGETIFVKDLSLLGRDLSQSIIVDNSPMSYAFHQNNAIDCSSFFDDREDRELDQIRSFLAGIRQADDVRTMCKHWRTWPSVSQNQSQPNEQQQQTEAEVTSPASTTTTSSNATSTTSNSASASNGENNKEA